MTATAVTYEIHPLAHLLPEMREAEFAELREDIAANGLHEAITLYEGKVLDGRHRYRACSELGVWPTFTSYEGDAPAAYVLSLNVKRRQLSQSQKAMLATDFLPHLKREARARQAHGLTAPGRPLERSSSEDGKRSGSAATIAEQMGVGEAQVVRAARVKREAPELAARVRAGEVTVSSALDHITGRRPLGPATGGVGRDGSKRREQCELVGNLVAKMLGLTGGFEHIDTATAIASANGSLAKWDRELTDIIVPLSRLRGDIRKALAND